MRKEAIAQERIVRRAGKICHHNEGMNVSYNVVICSSVSHSYSSDIKASPMRPSQVAANSTTGILFPAKSYICIISATFRKIARYMWWGTN
jgi:hypothetical protein